MFQIDQKDRYGGKVELYPEIYLDTVEITRRQDEKTISMHKKEKRYKLLGQVGPRLNPPLIEMEVYPETF